MDHHQLLLVRIELNVWTCRLHGQYCSVRGQLRCGVAYLNVQRLACHASSNNRCLALGSHRMTSQFRLWWHRRIPVVSGQFLCLCCPAPTAWLLLRCLAGSRSWGLLIKNVCCVAVWSERWGSVVRGGVQFRISCQSLAVEGVALWTILVECRVVGLFAPVGHRRLFVAGVNVWTLELGLHRR